ncbi:hypothetical protein H8B02_07000 [Bradyrhizobium sp. Pear77]|uniref:hypothetical protein n=1 Tax=Bradyrhizobium altum TaxID=1571202 RepID=UPI001E573662|nr:hypothetical protein [Bradyrhizobium altum]MCC8953223.1 hypothetical protein [Bradyrhizobium altum]
MAFIFLEVLRRKNYRRQQISEAATGRRLLTQRRSVDSSIGNKLPRNHSYRRECQLIAFLVAALSLAAY